MLGDLVGAAVFFHTMEIPKNRLAVRPAVLQDSLSRLLIATAVAAVCAEPGDPYPHRQ